MEQQIINIITTLLQNNSSLISIALRQRAKFEGWLKFELANRLLQSYKDTRVEFPIGGKHIDIMSNNSLIELKTPNTNYNATNVEHKTKPITKNVSGIVNDIKKLRDLRGNHDAYIAFVMFPIDDTLYRKHVNTIENALGYKPNVSPETITIGDANFLIYSAKVI